MMHICARYVPLDVRAQIYFAFAQSYLLYSRECWGMHIICALIKWFLFYRDALLDKCSR